ncbi:MAG: hypothetical protein EBY41_01075 [Proteobacteria bacterium]|nr:hypothetical protein [Pseudomonadota bacterium]
MGLSHNSIGNYYTLNFSLAQYHKWSIKEIEEMYPFERDLYVEMLKDYLDRENNRLENAARG